MMPIRTLTALRRTAQMTIIALALAGPGGVAAAAPDLVLRYDHPAQDNDYGWEREALPIGNGRIGAMVFGGIAREHLQFNDITLWSGDDRETGTYQPFGDVVVDLPGHDADARDYHRLLDIAHGIHAVTYTHGGVRFRREAWASHPADCMTPAQCDSQPRGTPGSCSSSVSSCSR